VCSLSDSASFADATVLSLQQLEAAHQQEEHTSLASKHDAALNRNPLTNAVLCAAGGAAAVLAVAIGVVLRSRLGGAAAGGAANKGGGGALTPAPASGHGGI
jgi:hypothetical protein